MTWADKRIREYRDGQPPTFLERIMLGIANPVALLLAITLSVYNDWTLSLG